MESPKSSSAPTSADNDEDRFLVRSQVEITFILKAVMQAGEIVTAYFNEGGDFAITALLAVDNQGGFAVLDANEALVANRRLLTSERVSFITNQDRVKIQFDASSVTPIEFEHRPALRVKLPATLLKYQRRECYRVPTRTAKSLKCVVPRSATGRSLLLSIVDIGLGGVCLSGYPDNDTLEAGMTLENCAIDLPGIGLLTTTLQVRNCFEIPLPNGLVNRRAGCMFLKLPPASEAMIQRYIIRLERDRRTKGNDG